MREELKTLKNEFQKKVYAREFVKDERCANCGTRYGLEFHHIVPLSKGGRNVRSNVTTLCWKCHASAHDKTLSKRRDAGRSRIEKPDNYQLVIRKVIRGEMKSSDALIELGIKKNTFYRWLNEYMRDNGIERNGHNFGKGGQRDEKGDV